LENGRKQQKELIELIDAAKPTIRKHLKDLVENNQIKQEKEGRSVFYYRPDRGKDPIEPKPKADPDEVEKLLYQLNSTLNNSEYSTTPSKSFHDLVLDFLGITNSYYYVLQDPEDTTIELFFDAFDQLIEEMEHIFPPEKEFGTTDEEFLIGPNRSNRSSQRSRPNLYQTTPDITYELFFRCAHNLYNNWEKEKEHPDFHNELVTRLNELRGIIGDLPESIASQLQTLALTVDQKMGRNFLMILIKSGNFDNSSIRTDLFYSYDTDHDLDALIKDLQNIKNNVSGERSEYIEELIAEIKLDNERRQ